MKRLLGLTLLILIAALAELAQKQPVRSGIEVLRDRTFYILPQAGALVFDDSGWEVLDPTTLDARRSTGRLSFNWYRIGVTVPERVASLATAGATVVFEIQRYQAKFFDALLDMSNRQSDLNKKLSLSKEEMEIFGRNKENLQK